MKFIAIPILRFAPIFLFFGILTFTVCVRKYRQLRRLNAETKQSGIAASETGNSGDSPLDGDRVRTKVTADQQSRTTLLTHIVVLAVGSVAFIWGPLIYLLTDVPEIVRFRGLQRNNVRAITIFRADQGVGGVLNRRPSEIVATANNPMDIDAAFLSLESTIPYSRQHESFGDGYLLRLETKDSPARPLYLWVYLHGSRDSNIVLVAPMLRYENTGSVTEVPLGEFVCPKILTWIQSIEKTGAEKGGETEKGSEIAR